jgi:hypothetical protein
VSVHEFRQAFPNSFTHAAMVFSLADGSRIATLSIRDILDSGQERNIKFDERKPLFVCFLGYT